MNSKRVYFIMLAAVAVLFVGLLAGTCGINALLVEQSTSLSSLKAKASALEKEQASLTIAKKQVAQYSSLNQIVTSIVPEDKDQAEATREIASIADQNGIKLGSITFPASNLGTTTGLPSTTGSATTQPKPFGGTAANSKTSALSQLQPLKSIPGVYVLQITVAGDTSAGVPYSQFINFLSGLEHNRRTAQVSTISITPDPKTAGYVTFSLTLDEYIKP